MTWRTGSWPVMKSVRGWSGKLWLREKRQALPQPWPEAIEGRLAADGSKQIGRFRILNVDPLEQSYTRQVRLEKWKSGTLIRAEEYTLRGNMYFKNEVLLMLKLAGFDHISVHGDYSDQPATSEHEELIFTVIR